MAMVNLNAERDTAAQVETGVYMVKKIGVKKASAVKDFVKIRNRKPFVPCDHDGTCEQAKCRCFTQGITCEKTCACPKNCTRKFKGCSCARQGRTCWDNAKCACYGKDRECDEDLCKSCGADEVLHPLNRYEPDITLGRCLNVGIQRNVPKRTILGSSEVMGFGLFAGEAIKKHEFIAEYKGEILTREESDRRGATYNCRPASYLFKLNKRKSTLTRLLRWELTLDRIRPRCRRNPCGQQDEIHQQCLQRGEQEL